MINRPPFCLIVSCPNIFALLSSHGYFWVCGPRALRAFWIEKRVFVFHRESIWTTLSFSFFRVIIMDIISFKTSARSITSLFILIFYFKGENPNSSLLSGLKITASKPISINPQNINQTKSPLSKFTHKTANGRIKGQTSNSLHTANIGFEL